MSWRAFLHVSCVWGYSWIYGFILSIKLENTLASIFSTVFSLSPLSVLSGNSSHKDISLVPQFTDLLFIFKDSFFSLYFILDSFYYCVFKISITMSKNSSLLQCPIPAIYIFFLCVCICRLLQLFTYR